MKSNRCVPCSKTTIYMNELLLPSVTLFDIKCKKLNSKNLWKCIFKGSRGVNFSYVSKFALDHEGCPPIPFKIFVGQITIFNSSTMAHLRWSYL